MKKQIIFLFLVCTILVAGCREALTSEEGLAEGIDNAPTDTRIRNISAMSMKAVPGRVIIKVNEETIENMQFSSGDIVLMGSVPSLMKQTLSNLRVSQMSRLFPYAGKYEQRTRKAGLHRWFVVEFDKNTPVLQAAQSFDNLPGIEIIEADYPIRCADARVKFGMPVFGFQTASNDAPAQRETKPYFNDPMLGAQWHYNNLGNVLFSTVGADVNLYKAWAVTTGSPDVIISVVDGGIDINHEDLKESIYINEKERTGTPNVDDDNNGVIDDIYGYNYALENNIITPDEHGTHVAGTVAARNNNGIGVCGVAGGNGDKNSGVRLISCQIFDGKRQGVAARAIKQGADMGAIISQNSWGYDIPLPDMPTHLKDAIDYFIENAGCDEKGEQRANSKMKGGVVIFAAGNEDKDDYFYPAAYEKVISVSAMSINFTKASYTNRGDWVTLMAPGGDIVRFGNEAGVLSTVPKTEKTPTGYKFLQGTSMACPHVSGIASLIVSKNGGKGYTNKQLVKALTSSYLPENIDDHNPEFAGRLGRGYIDAAGVFDLDHGKAPETPSLSLVHTDFTSLEISWKPSKDEDDGQAMFYHIYIKEGAAIGSEDLSSIKPLRINGMLKDMQKAMTYTLRHLKHTTTYGIAIIAEDRWQNRSKPSFLKVATLTNKAPVLNLNTQEKIKVSIIKNARVMVKYSDPDGHAVKYTVEGQTAGVSYVENEKGTIEFTIRPVLPVGVYTFKITATDELNSSSTMDVHFEVCEFAVPKVVAPFSKMIAGLDEPKREIPLKGVFSYDSELKVTLTAVSGNSSIATASVKDNHTLVVTPISEGECSIRVTLSDNIHNPVTTSFIVKIVKRIEDPVYMLYPLPVVDNLNILVNSKVASPVCVVLTPQGEEVLRVSATPDKQGLVTLDVREIVPGSYIFALESSNYKTFKKPFVK